MDDAYTVGVEEEYQLVCEETGELRSRARDVLRTDWSSEIRKEVQQTMLEVGTKVCADAAEVGRELRRIRFQVASAAASEGLAIVAAGLHPFSEWTGHEFTPEHRYQRLVERLGRVIRTEHVFGMHVHVAVPPRLDRIRLMQVLRVYLPHLLALSASSPFYEGSDTRYASYRTILTGRLPHSGVPPRLENEGEYRRFLELMSASGSLEDASFLYWNLRPHPIYPTVEFRVTDVCPRADDAVAIAALIRALVLAVAEGDVREPEATLSPSARDAVIAANQWQAARYGLEAVFAAPEREDGHEPVREAVLRLVQRLRPHAEGLGDEQAFAHLNALMERGSGAARMRTALKSCGTLQELVLWLVRESLVGTGMDRRRESRDACH